MISNSNVVPCKWPKVSKLANILCLGRIAVFQFDHKKFSLLSIRESLAVAFELASEILKLNNEAVDCIFGLKFDCMKLPSDDIEISFSLQLQDHVSLVSK